ncbi:hypothetical protein GCK72_010815 [Caenorhabditis remanei]|uniref:Uncharacterized protein n=1 Tax=Caenorhabditis remanei TaxID=31234 RepID=A0A6A5H7R4_CAERE|nr:hypothetical protein GCK72_010815 [Caenorhabditis remanei]KAF1762553.1 hypothetical protein GCK72_010815 [Caenorhabditis remanei]
MQLPIEKERQVAMFRYNLLTDSDTLESLGGLLENEYPLKLYRANDIRRITMRYLSSESREIAFFARKLIVQIDDMERKMEQIEIERSMKRGNESFTSSSVETSTKPLPLSEDAISCKRTMPTIFVPKKRGAVPVACQKPQKPEVQIPEINRISVEKKMKEERRIEEYLERKKLIAEEKKREEAIRVSKVKNAFEEARLKRKQEAMKAREQGFWEEDQPKPKKAKYSKRRW